MSRMLQFFIKSSPIEIEKKNKKKSVIKRTAINMPFYEVREKSAQRGKELMKQC